MISRGTERKKERKTNTYRNAPREDEHPENNAKDASNNALLRLFVLLVVCLFNKKSGMVFKLLLLIQSTNQRSEKVGFFVLEKRRNQFLMVVFKQREGGVKTNVREQRRRAFLQRVKGNAMMKVLSLLFSSSIR